jgi:hypothetical protein
METHQSAYTPTINAVVPVGDVENQRPRSNGGICTCLSSATKNAVAIYGNLSPLEVHLENIKDKNLLETACSTLEASTGENEELIAKAKFTHLFDTVLTHLKNTATREKYEDALKKAQLLTEAPDITAKTIELSLMLRGDVALFEKTRNNSEEHYKIFGTVVCAFFPLLLTVLTIIIVVAVSTSASSSSTA